MAYCPECGREQRCGCSECHSCGVPLEEGSGPPRAPSVGDAGGRPAGFEPPGFPGVWEEGRGREVPGAVRQPVNWLTHVFLILGSGLLLICLVDMANAVKYFPAVGPVASAAEGTRRAGYYLGILLYTNSARVLTGFALAAGGVLSSRMTGKEAGWERGIRGMGFCMGGASAIFFLAALLLVLPLGRVPSILEVKLPPLWAAVPVLSITGAALLGAGYLMAARLATEKESMLGRLRGRVRKEGSEDW